MQAHRNTIIQILFTLLSSFLPLCSIDPIIHIRAIKNNSTTSAIFRTVLPNFMIIAKKKLAPDEKPLLNMKINLGIKFLIFL